MKLTVPTAAGVLALLLTACGATGHAPHARPADGTVVGTFRRVGGPLGAGGTQPPSIPLMGTLRFTAGHRRAVAVQVGKTGRFSVRLPAGRYVVSGRSPSIRGVLASGAVVESPCTSPRRSRS